MDLNSSEISPAMDCSSVSDIWFSNDTSSSESNIAEEFLHSSSDSDEVTESDDERGDELFPIVAILLHGRLKGRVTDFIEVARRKNNEEFRDDFRVTRDVFNLLLDSLERSGKIPKHGSGREKISAELSLLVTLWFLSKEAVHTSVADLFGISDSSVHRIVKRVLGWLMDIMPQVVVWPTGSEILRVSQSLEQLATIANCIGVIDTLHIPILQPMENGSEYLNEKQNYSIILQAVVDCDMKFTNLFCGDPGSFHNIKVLMRSNLFHEADTNFERLFPCGSFLLGGKEYIGMDHKWIVTPFPGDEYLIPEQIDFNKRVLSTHVVIEQALLILKSRFRKLKMLKGLNMQFMVSLILGCCVLHNLCISNGDIGDDFEQDYICEDGGDEYGEVDKQYPNNITQNERQLQLFSEMYPNAKLPNIVRKRKLRTK